jgi:hypothetical protein
MSQMPHNKRSYAAGASVTDEGSAFIGALSLEEVTQTSGLGRVPTSTKFLF